MTDTNLADLPAQDETALSEALHALQAAGGDDALTDTLVVSLNDVEDTVQEAFTSLARSVMGRVPADAAAVAERAVAAVIADRVKRSLDGQLQRADQIRADG